MTESAADRYVAQLLQHTAARWLPLERLPFRYQAQCRHFLRQPARRRRLWKRLPVARHPWVLPAPAPAPPLAFLPRPRPPSKMRRAAPTEMAEFGIPYPASSRGKPTVPRETLVLCTWRSLVGARPRTAMLRRSELARAQSWLPSVRSRMATFPFGEADSYTFQTSQ